MSAAVGRRVAQWRVRRRMTQQVFADRIGRSKSWVEKIERGARSLDRFSLICTVAEVLRIDPAELLDANLQSTPAGVPAGVDAVRAALASYHAFAAAGSRSKVPNPADVAQRVEHAWATYRHGDHPRLLRMLPELLGAVQHLHATGPAAGAELQALAYQVTAQALVKVDEPDLAWLAADRALATAGDDPLLATAAAIPLGQALRGLGQSRLAMAATIAAAHRLTASANGIADIEHKPLYGTLLLQAAVAAAGCGDTTAVTDLIGQAAAVAGQVEDGQDHRQATFGPAAVDCARVSAAVTLGDASDAARRHPAIIRRNGWLRLPAEHRAAYLVDAARAFLHIGDLVAAGRTLVDADRLAPAEIRCRPTTRSVIAEIARSGPGSAGVGRLAAALGLTVSVG
ncbi:helix-turn-helix domain-containing protein [Micromonospora sp. LOL_023]|uniref:helix-turn-helix domain-containing protein n=1 Tax=Micromonospora sp. LOL_023 TaxID=3345418 RepID=UPI003A87FD1F